MPPRLLVIAAIALLIGATPAQAYLFGPSCDSAETIKAFVAEAQCSLLRCRAEPLNRPVDQIKALSAKELDAIFLARQKARAAKEGGDVPPAIVEYGAFIRGFTVNMYLHMSRLNLAVTRTTEISHLKSQLTCTAEITFDVAEAREAIYNQIAARVYSQHDDATLLLGAIENGDTNAIDQTKATDRTAWLNDIDKKLRSPRMVTFVVTQGPSGLVVSTPSALLMN